MIGIKNPISDWLNEGKQKAVEAEAKAKIRISDYTASNGETYTALLVDGIFVMRITSDNIQEAEKQLENLRIEYINKNF